MPTGIGFESFSRWWYDAMVRVTWQGALAVGAVWLVIRLLPRMSGDARCWLWRLVYLKLFLSMVVGSPLAVPILPSSLPATPEVVTPSFQPRTVSSDRALSLTTKPLTSSGGDLSVQDDPVSGDMGGTLIRGVCLLWLCGVVWGLRRLVLEWRAVRRILGGGSPVAEDSMRDLLQTLAWRFDWRVAPELRTQGEIDSPLLIGARKPVIVLPHELLRQCDAQELRFMLAHELAHGKRRDLVWAWLPALAQILFFFHPCVWLAHHEWRLSQELACDALTLQVLEAPAGEYGQVLLKVAAHCRPRRRLENATVAGVENYASLKVRLQALAPVSLANKSALTSGLAWVVLSLSVFLPWRLTERAGAEGLSTGMIDLGTNADLHGWRPFPSNNPWNVSIANAPLNAESKALINQIGEDAPLIPSFGTQNSGGEAGMPYLVVSGRETRVPVGFHLVTDSDAGPYPVPPSVPVERNVNSAGDQHVLVIDRDNQRLYEMWRPQWMGRRWTAQCGAIFDLTSNAVRRARFTSAAGSGLPIFPGLVRYDEVRVGVIRHALRFEAPHTGRAFLFPARHYASLSFDPHLPPMGLHVRLRADFDLSNFGPQSRVILQALKSYGMFLADNGTPWSLSGAPSDQWDEQDLKQLSRVRGHDFEVVQSGPLTVAPPGPLPTPNP